MANNDSGQSIEHSLMLSTYSAALIPSQVELSFMRILSRLIPSFSYISINRRAFFNCPSMSKESLKQKKQCEMLDYIFIQDMQLQSI